MSCHELGPSGSLKVFGTLVALRGRPLLISLVQLQDCGILFAD